CGPAAVDAIKDGVNMTRNWMVNDVYPDRAKVGMEIGNGAGKAYANAYNTVTGNPGTSITSGVVGAGSFGILKYRGWSNRAAAAASSVIATIPGLANVGYYTYGGPAAVDAISDAAGTGWNWATTGWDTGYLASAYNTVTGNPGTSITSGVVGAGSFGILKYRGWSNRAAAAASSVIATIPGLANVGYYTYGGPAAVDAISDAAGTGWNWATTGWDTGYLASAYNTVTGNPGTSITSGVVGSGSYMILRSLGRLWPAWSP